jgi:hypothetical protein
MIGFIGTSVTITINDNSSQSMAVYDSLHSLLDHECLLFCCDEWRMKYHCSLNHWTLLRMPNDWTLTNWPEYRSPPWTVRVILSFHCHETCLPNRWLAMIFLLWLHYSGFQAVLTKPLPSNGHIRYNIIPTPLSFFVGARGSQVGWGTMLQDGRLQIEFPHEVFGFFQLT